MRKAAEDKANVEAQQAVHAVKALSFSLEAETARADCEMLVNRISTMEDPDEARLLMPAVKHAVAIAAQKAESAREEYAAAQAVKVPTAVQEGSNGNAVPQTNQTAQMQTMLQHGSASSNATLQLPLDVAPSVGRAKSAASSRGAARAAESAAVKQEQIEKMEEIKYGPVHCHSSIILLSWTQRLRLLRC